MLYPLLRPLLFQLPPEAAHHAAFSALVPLQLALEHLPSVSPPSDPSLRQELWGLKFPNPIGLAAGFDKNAALPHVWGALGFGFAELGTITAHAQPGNPAPRLFRLADDRALINRLGFNNDGAAAVAAALARHLAAHRPLTPLGINLGKSRVTPIDEAITDYCTSLRHLFPLADYVTINVSSPNTPGLRDLQAAAQLAPLLEAVQATNRQLAAEQRTAARPLLVKVAPDLSEADLREVVAVARTAGVAGIIATNTTLQRPDLRAPAALAQEAGGLSGAPLRQLSTDVIRALYRAAGPALPIIGVGGIFSAADAYEKIRAGAALLQVYTGFIYEGPTLPRRLCTQLAQLLARDGFAHLRDAVGVDAPA